MKLKTLKTIIRLTEDYRRTLRRALASYKDFKTSLNSRERVGFATLSFDNTCKANGIYESCLALNIPTLREYLQDINREVYGEFNVACGDEYSELINYLGTLNEKGE